MFCLSITCDLGDPVAQALLPVSDFCFSPRLRASVVRFWPSDSTDFCSPLLASFSQKPTPHRRFVANKGSTLIRPSGRPNGQSHFSRFSAAQSLLISPPFSRSKCSVGRGSQCFHQVPNTKNQVPAIWPTANCQLLTALFSKSFLETSHPWAPQEYSRFV
jgi:hypothetical protein